MADDLPVTEHLDPVAAKQLLVRLGGESVLAEDLGRLQWQLLEFRDAWYVSCRGRLTPRVWATYCRIEGPRPQDVVDAWAQALALHWWEMSWT